MILSRHDSPPRLRDQFLRSMLALVATRRGLFDDNGRQLLRSTSVASGIAVLVLLLLIALRPLHQQVVVRVRLPEPERTIVLPLPEPPKPAEALEQLEVATVLDPPPDAMPVEPLPRRAPEPLDPTRGKEGRARAEQATRALEGATRALDRSLAGLDATLASARDGRAEPVRRRRGDIAGGRTDAQLAAVGDGAARRGAPELHGSALNSSQLAIGAPAAPPAGVMQDGPSGAGSAPGVHRSNASLLAVIQRCAPGIQYCYTNELKREPALRGKLVVALTIAASGAVTDAVVVSDTVGGGRLSACALAQIREWRFPAIASGVTTFQVPFVFTPPK